MRRQNKLRSLPFIFTQIGRWWGTDSKKKIEVEIDIIAYHKGQAIFCECKWRNELTDQSTLMDLIKKSHVHPKFNKQFTHNYYALFSKSGFTDGLKEYASSRDDVLLFELDDLFK